jgi:hypothetical protein
MDGLMMLDSGKFTHVVNIGINALIFLRQKSLLKIDYIASLCLGVWWSEILNGKPAHIFYTIH